MWRLWFFPIWLKVALEFWRNPKFRGANFTWNWTVRFAWDVTQEYRLQIAEKEAGSGL
jgi:hypothetical protein